MVEDARLKRLFARVGRLNRTINLGNVLYEYGYDVYADGHREQQFRCDLHGDDNKPSARFYPETNSTYCWACQKARRPVDYYVEKEGYGTLDSLQDDPFRFDKVLTALEGRYGLEALSWKEAENPQNEAQEWIRSKLDEHTNPRTSFQDDRTRIRRLLEAATVERDLEMGTLLKYWEVFDRIDFGMRHEEWTEVQGKKSLAQLRKKLMESFK